jgi:predicted transcriptional regulator
MAVWGLVVAVLLAVGSLPFFVGLAVVLPVLGHATWHLYRKVVEPDPNPPQEEPRPPMIAVKKIAGACVQRGIQMTTVRQLLDQKGRNIWSIHTDATVFDAIAKMAEKDTGSLVVMEGEELVGIVTERHYARNVVLKGETSPATPVRDIMERHAVIAQSGQSVDECMAIM